MENKDKKKAAIQKLMELGTARFGFLGSSDDSASADLVKLSDEFTKSDIKSWFIDPEANKEDLINVSRYFYISQGYYYRIVNYYVDLLRLDYVMTPKFMTLEMSDKETVFQQELEVRNYLEKIIDKTTVRKLLKAVLKEGVFYGYEREKGDEYYLQRLPSQFCRMGSEVVNGLLTIEFNFSFFDNKEDTIFDLYDPEFKSLYNKYVSDGDLKWQQLNPDRTVLIMLEEDDYTFPMLTGTFFDSIDLDDFYMYLKKGIQKDITKLLIQKGDINPETGDPVTDPEILAFYQEAISEVLGEDTNVISTLFDVDTIDFTSSKSGDAGYTSVDTMRDKVMSGASMSDAILGNGDSATALRMNHNSNVSYMMTLLEKIEKWINTRLRENFASDIIYSIRYMPTTTVNRDEIFKLHKQMLDVGGSLFSTISSMGMNPYEYIDLIKYENLMGYKDELELTGNINTQTTDTTEGGRPEVEDGKISDSGEQTKDTDGNDR